jgi:hypothetical protein
VSYDVLGIGSGRSIAFKWQTGSSEAGKSYAPMTRSDNSKSKDGHSAAAAIAAWPSWRSMPATIALLLREPFR